MAQYRLKRTSSDTYTLSANMVVDGVLKHSAFKKGLKRSELFDAAKKMAEDVQAVRVRSKPIWGSTDVPGRTR